MATKVTKTDNFNAIREILVNADKPELVAFVDHELELIARKAERRSNTPTKAQVAGTILRQAVLDLLQTEEKAMRIADIVAALPVDLEATPGKVSHQLTVLIGEHSVEKEVVKRVNYYKAV